MIIFARISTRVFVLPLDDSFHIGTGLINRDPIWREILVWIGASGSIGETCIKFMQKNCQILDNLAVGTEAHGL